MGEMGMTIEELYNMTPRQFQNKREGYRRAVEGDMQTRWESVRWLAAVVIAPHIKKRLRPKDLMAFPWDVGRVKHRAATFEEVKEAVKKVFGNE